MFWDISDSLPVLRIDLLPVLWVHFAWIGIMAGGATVAVALDILGSPDCRKALAATLIDRVLPGPRAAAVLCVTAVLILLGVRFGYPPLNPSDPFWAATIVPLLAGIGLLALYRRLLRQGRGMPLRPCCGLAGIALVLASIFLFCCGSGLLVMPEKWPFLSAMPLSLLSWCGTARYLEFTCLALATTGAVVILLSERTTEPDDARFFAYRLGRGMSLFFLIAWPPTLLFWLFNLPTIALSSPVLLIAAVGLVVAAIIAFLLLGTSVRLKSQSARKILALYAALFTLWILDDHLARVYVLDEATLEGFVTPVRAPAPAKAAPATKGAEAVGKEVFERICMTCHRFDEKLVGPPLKKVVPKYRNNPEALKAFIRSPVKKDPAYPSMPKLPLTDAEIEAVAAYLLEKAAP